MTKTQPTTNEATTMSLTAQNTILMNAMFGPHGVTSGLEVLEKNLAQAMNADPLDAPFPLVGAEATLWHRATSEAYRHALEMVCICDKARALAPATSIADNTAARASSSVVSA